MPAVSGVGVSLVNTYIGFGSWDGVRWFHLFFPILWTTGTILIWRSVVMWTLGRACCTAIVSMIPFIQVAVGLPLWTHSGCLGDLSDGMLRIGQHQVLAGVFVWLTMWVWWGVEKAIMTLQGISETTHKSRRVVGPLARCLLASIASIPVVVGVFFVIFVLGDDLVTISDPWLAYASTAVLAVSIWMLIWRRQMVWSRGVGPRLVFTTLLCFVVPITLCAMLLETGSQVVNVVLVCLPIIGWGVWMAVALPIRRLRAGVLLSDEGEDGPRCLKCGYLLKGLTATRCPECGDEPTLDELWAASVTDL